MEIMGVSSTAFDARHESVPLLSSMSAQRPHKQPLKTSSSLPNFLSNSSMFVSVPGPSRQIIAPPLRTSTPTRVPPPPIDTSSPTPSRSGPQPLERVPTEPASAPPPRQQPTADELALLGIKVRDFAFEPNTLPPVPAVKKPFFQELGRQVRGIREDYEVTQRNEARRLDFNTPRRNGPLDNREALRLAFNSPRTKDTSSGGLQPPSRLGGTFSNHLDIFSKWDSILNVGAGPSPGYGFSPRPRLPLQRQPSEIYLPHANVGMASMDLSMGLFSPNRVTRQGPALSSSRASSTYEPQAHESFISSQLPGLAQDWLTRSSRAPQSQPLAPVSQPESVVQSSQSDSEMDDEEYVKTPLVTPNGSLIFEDEGSNTYDDFAIDSNSADAGNGGPTNIVGMNGSVIDSSALPESQMAQLLPAVDFSVPEENLSASQMGLESQDLLSQPAWQQQSQSQAQTWSQLPESQTEGDVDMPDSQLGDEGSRNTGCDRTPTLTPTPSLTRVSSTLVSPIRPCASANSNHSATSPRPRPISRISPRSSPSRRSPSLRSLTSTHSQSSLRRSPSFNKGGNLSRHPSFSSSKAKPGLSVVPTSLLSVGKARYNLRSPSPKKAKLLGVPSPTSASASRPRARSRTQSAPTSKRGATSAANAAVARRTRSAARARSRAKETQDVRKDGDVEMANAANEPQALS